MSVRYANVRFFVLKKNNHLSVAISNKLEDLYEISCEIKRNIPISQKLNRNIENISLKLKKNPP